MMYNHGCTPLFSHSSSSHHVGSPWTASPSGLNGACERTEVFQQAANGATIQPANRLYQSTLVKMVGKSRWKDSSWKLEKMESPLHILHGKIGKSFHLWSFSFPCYHLQENGLIFVSTAFSIINEVDMSTFPFLCQTAVKMLEAQQSQGSPPVAILRFLAKSCSSHEQCSLPFAQESYLASGFGPNCHGLEGLKTLKFMKVWGSNQPWSMNVSCVIMLGTAKILWCLKRSLANHAINRRWTGAIVVCFIERIYRLCDSIVMFCSNKMAVVVRTSLLTLLSKFQKRSKKNCQWMSMVWIVRCSPICAICLHTIHACITCRHNHRLAPAPCQKVGLAEILPMCQPNVWNHMVVGQY